MKKGLEIERRFLMVEPNLLGATVLKENLKLYDRVLREGTTVVQGYIFNSAVQRKALEKLDVTCEFEIDTFRLRKYGNKYYLTLKDKGRKKNNIKKEQEQEISRAQFLLFWPLTKGHRIRKKRLELFYYINGIGSANREGWKTEYDAFTDRFLLIAEVEVKSLEEYKRVPDIGLDVSNITKWSNKNLSK